jgi:hypothetical protein
MTRFIGSGAVALGALLAAGNLATAGDTVLLGGSKSGISGATVNLAGSGTVAGAAAAGDVEEMRGFHGGYRGGYGGYRGGYGGYRGGYGGYRGGYGGYRGGFYGGGYRGYRGGFYGGYARPYFGGFYRGFGYRPYYGYGYGGLGYGGYGYGGLGYGSGGYGGGFYGLSNGYFGGYSGYNAGFCGISGTAADAAAPVYSLALPQSGSNPAGTFNYDGGTVAPSPTPVTPQRTAPTVDLAVSLKPAKTSKYSFKAYGEK